MDENTIEELAVCHVKRILLRCGYIDAYISTKEKTPSWDGYLYIYNTRENRQKSNILGVIPVQVKGTNNKVEGDEFSYRCDVSDLINYRNDRGCLYFRVYVDPSNDYYKIYYADLLPYTISLILQDKKDQQTCNIRFISFPEDNCSEIFHILTTFILNSPKQMGVNGKRFYTVNEIKQSGYDIRNISFEMLSLGSSIEDIERYIVKHDFYLYAQLKGLDIEIPLGKTHFEKMSRHIDASIKINNKEYYTSYTIITENTKRSILIGKSICITQEFGSNVVVLSATMSGSISDIINDYTFYLEVISNKVITINEINISFNGSEDCNIESIKALIQYYKTAKIVLDELGVKDELMYELMDETAHKNLKSFVISYLDNKEIIVSLNDNYTNNRCGFMTIGNITIMVWIDKKSNDNYKLENYFTKTGIRLCSYSDDDIEFNNPIPSSRYFILNRELFKKLSNIDFEVMFNEFKSLSINEYISEQIIRLCLEMISAYDDQDVKNHNLINYAEKIFIWLSEVADDIDQDIILLNKFQIYKRQRMLSQNEIELISKYKDTSYTLIIQCGASLLIDDIEGAQKCFDKMTVAEQCMFLTFPICKFGNLKRRNVEETPNG